MVIMFDMELEVCVSDTDLDHICCTTQDKSRLHCVTHRTGRALSFADEVGRELHEVRANNGSPQIALRGMLRTLCGVSPASTCPCRYIPPIICNMLTGKEAKGAVSSPDEIR